MNGAFRKLLLAKIHGAVVTEANVAYEGSITIPRSLLEITGLLPHESVHVWNVTRGTRFETYILDGGDRQREIHVNGAAAHLVEPGDSLIVAGFIHLPAETAHLHVPKVVFLHTDNSVKDIRGERPGTIAA
ncbi:MAG: Aspartate 1-decarboxylase [Pseudomonadota bacterium]|jgi:aspartate 1-decarboxylase